MTPKKPGPHRKNTNKNWKKKKKNWAESSADAYFGVTDSADQVQASYKQTKISNS